MACYRETNAAAEHATDEHKDEKLLERIVWEDLPSGGTRTLRREEISGLAADDDDEEGDYDFTWRRTWSVLGE